MASFTKLGVYRLYNNYKNLQFLPLKQQILVISLHNKSLLIVPLLACLPMAGIFTNNTSEFCRCPRLVITRHYRLSMRDTGST